MANRFYDKDLVKKSISEDEFKITEKVLAALFQSVTNNCDADFETSCRLEYPELKNWYENYYEKECGLVFDEWYKILEPYKEVYKDLFWVQN